MDDWSLLPSRDAVSEPAPNPQSTMNKTTTLPARLTRPRQAPPTTAPITHTPNTRRLTRPPSPGTWTTNPGQSPRNPSKYTRFNTHRDHQRPTHRKFPDIALDNTRPFMDDIGAFAGDLHAFRALRGRGPKP